MSDRLVAVAGEASGDLIGGQALAGLMRARRLKVSGIGGPVLRSQGMDCWFDIEDLSVRGYVEALSRLPHILSVRRRLLKKIQAWQPSVYLGIDAPDFNLGVEARLRGPRLRTVHLVSPAIWAWRPERIHKIRQAVDHMLCLFPFELDCYRGTGVQASFVGHPLADQIPLMPNLAAARRQLSLETETRPVIAVLPGSRPAEIRHHGQDFLLAAAQLARHASVLIPVVSPGIRRILTGLAAYSEAAAAGVRFIDQPINEVRPNAHVVMEASNLVVVASGTATLEAALYKKPMVIGYRIPAFSYWLMRRKALVSDIGLPNLLLGRRLVPELIQEALKPEGLVREALSLLDDSQRQALMTSAFEALHQSLRQDCAARVADILNTELEHAHHRG